MNQEKGYLDLNPLGSPVLCKLANWLKDHRVRAEIYRQHPLEKKRKYIGMVHTAGTTVFIWTFQHLDKLSVAGSTNIHSTHSRQHSHCWAPYPIPMEEILPMQPLTLLYPHCGFTLHFHLPFPSIFPLYLIFLSRFFCLSLPWQVYLPTTSWEAWEAPSGIM
jgi:hypothetical protein